MKTSKLEQKFFLIVLLLLLGIVFFIGSSFLIKPKVVEISPSQVSESPPDQTQLIENKEITIILVGDIMLDRGVEYMVEKQGGGDFRFPFLKIAEELQKADILIVSLHSGEEYSNEPTLFQIEFSKTAIDAGADLVLGHHPHVIQPNEKYRDGYIFYSLGNFIFDQGFSEKTMKGQILEVLIENKQIKEVIAKEIKINNFFQPRLEIFDTKGY